MTQENTSLNAVSATILQPMKCRTCINRKEGHCKLGDTSTFKHWNTLSKHGGCNQGMQFNEKLLPKDRPKAIVTDRVSSPPYGWA